MKAGSKVEIIGNIPFPLKHKKRPLFGTITNIDGYYISVRPKNCRWTAEFYPNEIKEI